MPHSTYFVQGCPTCGRRLHVHVEYLGKKVVCQHCRAQFVACDGTGGFPVDACAAGGDDYATACQSEVTGALLRRANELLQRAADRVERGRQPHPK